MPSEAQDYGPESWQSNQSLRGWRFANKYVVEKCDVIFKLKHVDTERSPIMSLTWHQSEHHQVETFSQTSGSLLDLPLGDLVFNLNWIFPPQSYPLVSDMVPLWVTKFVLILPRYTHGKCCGAFEVSNKLNDKTGLKQIMRPVN